MRNPFEEQPDVGGLETGINELLKIHRAISEAWYSNWQAEQQARLNRLLHSRSLLREDGIHREDKIA